MSYIDYQVVYVYTHIQISYNYIHIMNKRTQIVR